MKIVLKTDKKPQMLFPNDYEKYKQSSFLHFKEYYKTKVHQIYRSGS